MMYITTKLCSNLYSIDLGSLFPKTKYEGKIHYDLIQELIIDYIGNDRHSDTFAAWKTAFKNVVDVPVQSNCSVLDNFNYLKRRGLLGVGRYNVIKKIFKKNEEALSAINLASRKMRDILERVGMDRQLLDDKPMTAKLLVEFVNGDIDVVKGLVSILHEMLINSHSIFNSLSSTEICLKILNGEETDENYSNVIQTLNTAHEKRGFILLKYGEKNQSEKLSKAILRVFLSLLSLMENEFGATKIDIDWDNSIVIIVKFASTKDCDKAINFGRGDLIDKVTDCFEIIFENMDRCKGEERQAHHQLHRVTINTVESSGSSTSFSLTA